MLELACILFFGFLLDIAIGDPRYRFHPIRIIGQAISILEKIMWKFGLNGRGGGIIFVMILLTTFLCVYLLTSLALYRLYSPLGLCFDLFICYSCFALKDLINHTRPVIRALEAHNLSEAREGIAKVVGRDVKYLDEKGISRAAIESLAENFVDGFLSPLFWYLIGGILASLSGIPPLKIALCFMLAFKVISTLDSMVGYKTPKYEQFGWAGARLDDCMNFIPARLSLIILFAGAWISRLHPLDGLKVAVRDRLKHDSPNAAHAESFVAGALHIRLCGPIMYPNGVKKKPWLGDGKVDPGPTEIRRTAFLVMLSAWIAIAVHISTLLLLA